MTHLVVRGGGGGGGWGGGGGGEGVNPRKSGQFHSLLFSVLWLKVSISV